MATLYHDGKKGLDANDGLSFANRVRTINGGITSARTAPGDVIRMRESRIASLGTYQWTNGSRQITGTFPIKTLTDATATTGWTASANVTLSTSTTRRVGANSVSLAIATAFTTGKIAYFDLGSSQDLSAYQVLNLWIRASATVGSGVLRVDLCSDATGDVPVHSFVISSANNLGSGINPSNQWHACVFDNNGNLSNSIRSIAIVAVSDPSTPTLLINNIFVSKNFDNANPISLIDGVSKSNDYTQWRGKATEKLYAIKFIQETVLEFDGDGVQTPGSGLVYQGTTESVETFVCEALPVPTPATSSTGTLGEVQESGSSALRSKYSGGWAYADMASQTGFTLLTSCSQLGRFFSNTTGRDFIDFERIGLINCSEWHICGADNYIKDCCVVNVANGFGCENNTNTADLTCELCAVVWSSGVGFSTGGTSTGGNLKYIDCAVEGSSTGNQGAWNVLCQPVIIIRPYVAYRASHTAFKFFAGCNQVASGLINVIDPVVTSNVQNTCRCETNSGLITIKNLTGQSPLVGFGGTITNHMQDRALFLKVAGSETDHRLVGNGFIISTDTATKRDGVFSWKINPTSTSITAIDPIKFKIGEVLCTANAQKTVKAWLRRSDLGLTIGLMVTSDQLYGMTTETLSPMTAAINTWEEVTLSFTPTETGIISVYVYAYGGTTFSGFVDGLVTLAG